ncbi:MAG: 4'-phosphopantetheinyl transferase superfamily protein [Pseudomonadota bacterium]
MTEASPEPIWHVGSLDTLNTAGDRPLAWHVRLDDPAIAATAARVRLTPEDLQDLAPRPDSATRAVRRQLVKAALATLAAIHPDRVRLGRTSGGAPLVLSPSGRHISVAGRWPHILIGVSRDPLGVDLEPADALPPPRDALTVAERAALDPADGDAALLRWVMKEAHAKCVGNASSVTPETIETVIIDGSALAYCAAGRSRCWLNRQNGLIAVMAVAQTLCT